MDFLLPKNVFSKPWGCSLKIDFQKSWGFPLQKMFSHELRFVTLESKFLKHKEFHFYLEKCFTSISQILQNFPKELNFYLKNHFPQKLMRNCIFFNIPSPKFHEILKPTLKIYFISKYLEKKKFSFKDTLKIIFLYKNKKSSIFY